MDDPEKIPTIPRPAAIPREEAPTVIPRTTSSIRLQALRESPEKPEWLEAIDELRAASEEREKRLMAAIALVAKSGAEEVERNSKTNFDQQEKINATEARVKKLEDDAATAAEKSTATETIAKAIAETVTTIAKPFRWTSPQVASLGAALLTALLGYAVSYLKAHGWLP